MLHNIYIILRWR